MRRIGLALLLLGCEQVTRLPAGPERVVPEPVWSVFDGSCRPAGGCHVMQKPVLGHDGAFVGTEAVVPFNPLASSVYTQIADGEMPPTSEKLDDERSYLVYGWIAAGAPLDEVGGEGTGSDSDSDSSEDDGGPDYVEFAVVLDVIRSNCGGMTCHRDGGRWSRRWRMPMRMTTCSAG